MKKTIASYDITMVHRAGRFRLDSLARKISRPSAGYRHAIAGEGTAEKAVKI